MDISVPTTMGRNIKKEEIERIKKSNKSF